MAVFSATFASSIVNRLAGASLLLVTGFLIYCVTIAVYRLFFHPLSKFPGPKLSAVTRLPHSRAYMTGDLAKWIQSLHATYGEVVRIAPNELSFISGETAWPDIYGFHAADAKLGKDWGKDQAFWVMPVNGVKGLIIQDAENHARQRRVIAHAFSDRALRDQEGILQKYVGLVIARLQDAVESGEGVDVVTLFNFFTFDVIGDLTFGESFGCLESNKYHEWVATATYNATALAVVTTINRYALLKKIMLLTVGAKFAANRRKFYGFVEDCVAKRLNAESARPDFFGQILKHVEKDDGVAMSRKEMDSNALTIIAAGVDTTHTVLCGALMLLAQHPQVQERLLKEIRSTFEDAPEITVDAVSKLPYLIAVLKETMRYFPPVSAGFGRVAPHGGGTVSGYYVPESTSVSVSHHAAYHSPLNFAEPDSFIPERWLETERDARFANDKHAAFNPFSFGPRHCVGKNLAYAEMRLLLARVLWEFDLELEDDPGMAWFDQKLRLFWEKPIYKVKVTSVKRST